MSGRGLYGAHDPRDHLGRQPASEVRCEPGTVPQRSCPLRGMSPVAWPGLLANTSPRRRAVSVIRGLRTAVTAREWGRLAAMFGFILAINVAGWAIFILYVMPHHFDYRGEGGSKGLGVGIGVAITAWLLGFRHAFDADHISCIDNTTRKLMADGKRPLGTGFFFSFGHSTVIVAVGVGITLAARAVFGAVVNPSPTYEPAGGAAGTLVSAGFL